MLKLKKRALSVALGAVVLASTFGVGSAAAHTRQGPFLSLSVCQAWRNTWSSGGVKASTSPCYGYKMTNGWVIWYFTLY